MLASGAPVTGTLNIAGTSVFTLLGIDFVPPPDAGVGEIVVLPGGNAGDFAFLNAGFNTGLLVDRDGSQVADETLNVPDWLTVPNFSFALQFIQPGTSGNAQCNALPAGGQTCTPAPFDPDGPGPLPSIVSAYNFENFGIAGNLSSRLSFSVRGTVTNLLNPSDTNAFKGEFTATFPNSPYQTVIATLESSGGAVPAPFMATFNVTAIPEPSSVGLILSGLALLSAGLLRRC